MQESILVFCRQSQQAGLIARTLRYREYRCLPVSFETASEAALAMKQLPKLAGCEAHSTVILPSVDNNIFKRLHINITCDAKYQTHKLFHK